MSSIALFAGIPVRDYAASRPWYERLLGSEPTFLVYVVEDAARAGHAVLMLFVDDLDAVVAEIASRGIEPAERETYSNGVRKVTYRDADGNEVGFGGEPV